MQFNSDLYIMIPSQPLTPVFEKLMLNKVRKYIILSTGPLRCNTLEFEQESTLQDTILKSLVKPSLQSTKQLRPGSV